MAPFWAFVAGVSVAVLFQSKFKNSSNKIVRSAVRASNSAAKTFGEIRENFADIRAEENAAVEEKAGTKKNS